MTSLKIGSITADLTRANWILASAHSSLFGRLPTRAIGFQLLKCFVEPFVCHFSLSTIRKILWGAVPISLRLV